VESSVTAVAKVLIVDTCTRYVNAPTTVDHVSVGVLVFTIAEFAGVVSDGAARTVV
jgi:hypothetical protein